MTYMTHCSDHIPIAAIIYTVDLHHIFLYTKEYRGYNNNNDNWYCKSYYFARMKHVPTLPS